MNQLLKIRQKSVAQSTNELLTLVNRVNILQNQKEKTEKRNILTLQKTNRILKIKQNCFLANKSINNSNIQKDSYQRKSSMVDSYNKDNLQSMNKEQYQDNAGQLILIKAQNHLSQLDHQQQQRDLIKQQKCSQKLRVQKFWHDRLQQYAKEKNLEKALQNQRCNLQDQSIIQLERLELSIIEQLQKSHSVNQVLSKQLEDAKTLSQDMFQQVYPEVINSQTAQVEKKTRKPIKSRYLYPANYNKFPENISLPMIFKGKNSLSQHWDVSTSLNYLQQKQSLIKIYQSNGILSSKAQFQREFTDRTHNRLGNNINQLEQGNSKQVQMLGRKFSKEFINIQIKDIQPIYHIKEDQLLQNQNQNSRNLDQIEQIQIEKKSLQESEDAEQNQNQVDEQNKQDQKEQILYDQ